MNMESKSILIAILLVFIGIFNCDSITITLSFISDSFCISTSFSMWVYLSFFLSCCGTGLFFGKFARKYGIVKFSIICVILGIIGSVLCLITLDISFIIIGNLLHGISASGTFTTLYVFIYRKVNINRIGRAMGLVTASGYLGGLLGPILGSIISFYLSWIWVYFFTFPLFIITLILLLTFDEEWVDDVVLDKFGSVLWFIFIILFMYALSSLDTYLSNILLLISILLLGIFIFYELNVDYPLFDLKVFKNNRCYSINNFIAFMGQFIRCGVVIVITLYFQYLYGLTAIEVGLIIGFYAAIVSILSLIVGIWSDKYNLINLNIYGLIFLIFSVFIFCFIHLTPFYIATINLVLFSIGVSLYETPNKKIIFESEKRMGLTEKSALMGTLRDMGYCVPAAIFQFILSIFISCNGLLYWISCATTMFQLILVFSLITFVIYVISMMKFITTGYKWDKS